MTPPKTLIEVRDLTFSYGAAPVLESVNLQVENGEFLGIVAWINNRRDRQLTSSGETASGWKAR